jgi:hypothetical protein
MHLINKSMENESNKEKDVLKEIGEGLSQFGQRLGKKVNELVENFSAEEGTGLGIFVPSLMCMRPRPTTSSKWSFPVLPKSR